LIVPVSCLPSKTIVTSGKIPEWVKRVPSEVGYIYFVASKTGAATVEDGKKDAFENALIQIAEYLGVKVDSTYMGGGFQISKKVLDVICMKTKARIEKAYLKEVFTQKHRNEEIGKDFYDVFVLVRYPVAEAAKERERIKEENRKIVKRAERYFQKGKKNIEDGLISSAFQNFSIALKILENTLESRHLRDEIFSFAVMCFKKIELAELPCDKIGDVKTGLRNPLKAKIIYKSKGRSCSVSGAIVNFRFLKGKGVLESFARSDKDGIARCFVTRINRIGKRNCVRAVLGIRQLLFIENPALVKELEIVEPATADFYFDSIGNEDDIEYPPLKIKVEKFKNLTGEVKMEWLAQAVTDGIVNRLSNCLGVKIVEDGEDYLVQGSYQKNNDVVRINVKLTESSRGDVTGNIQEQDKINRIFELEDKIATQIYKLLNIESVSSISGFEPKRINLDAYRFYNWGLISYQLGDIPKAVDMYKKTIHIQDDYADAYNNLGVCFFALGMYNKAISNYRRARKLSPLDDGVVINLANAYFQSGKRKKAIGIIEDYLKANPRSGDALFVLGVFLNKMALYQKASEILKVATKLKPTAAAYNELGLSFDNRGDFEQAVRFYKKAIEKKFSFYPAHNNLAIAYINLGQYDDALNEIKNSLALNYRCANTFNILGLAYSKKGSYDRAVLAYKRALEISPHFSTPYFNLACVYSAEGKNELALEFLQEAVSFGYNDIDSIVNEPSFESLKEDEEFQKILENLK